MENLNDENKDKSSPKAVLIDSSLINSESTYNISSEKSLEYYLRSMIDE